MPERELHHVSSQLGLGRYLAEIWTRREFIFASPLNNLRAANMDTVLGNAWFLVNPALSVGIYFVVFGLLLEIDRGIDNYVGYLVIGITFFNLLTQTMIKASRSMVANESLIRSLYFPRAIIPLSSSLEGLYTFTPSLVIMFVAVLVTGEPLTLQSLLVIPALALSTLFLVGVVFVVARLGRRFPDLASLLPHLTRLAFYASGVLYEPRRLTENEWVLRMFEWNPFYLAMLLPRHALLDTPASGAQWASMTGWAVAATLFGFIYFWRAEVSYGS